MPRSLFGVSLVCCEMNKITISRFLSLSFLLAMISFAVVFNVLKPRVMILHSYHSDYAWTRDIDVGLRRVTDGWTNYAVNWHYMDTKKHNDPRWLNRAGIIARRAIDQVDPHVLIAVDDLAQELAAKYYVNHPHIQIVFAGVNGEIAPYGYVGAKNVTGIYERKQLAAVQEAILALESKKTDAKLHPRVLYLLDPSPSMQKDRSFVDQFDWQPLLYTGSLVANDFEHWQQIVLKLADRNIDYLLIANYRKLPHSSSDTSLAKPQEVMEWTEMHSPIPVIGVNVFNVEDGGMLSVGVSPYEQGEVAAKMAQRILREKVHASAIPTVFNKLSVVAIRKQAMQRRGIQLPAVYEAFGRATAHYIE